MPGETMTCEAADEVVQADVDAGSFTNTAKAAATGPSSQTIEDSDTAQAMTDLIHTDRFESP
ncbi:MULTISPECIES: hypothetical protein [unclassified Wenzhouxiangella]|uniref:DUF7507 domain-containing protein n=1 Tax=unclassified Wenzhouxiangella TaxID=2613841 RepID=UPI000E32D162|nr:MULTISPECIES: hypothetical protein [unclassified Wenzhouxiangella]RFF27609.1 hypothetical protein DZK25_07015 [Wenzhouxiangella sp. 15181]RFP70133.1 hypothetical protein DZK26_01020 [Wenzhouxiangella sp. 15190]